MFLSLPNYFNSSQSIILVFYFLCVFLFLYFLPEIISFIVQRKEYIISSTIQYAGKKSSLIIGIFVTISLFTIMVIFSLNILTNGNKDTFTKKDIPYTKIVVLNTKSKKIYYEQNSIKNDEYLSTDYQKLINKQTDDSNEYLIPSKKWNENNENIKIKNITFKKVKKNDLSKYKDEDFINILYIKYNGKFMLLLLLFISFSSSVFVFKLLRFNIYSPIQYSKIILASKYVSTVPTLFFVIPKIIVSFFINAKIQFFNFKIFDHHDKIVYPILYIYFLSVLFVAFDNLTSENNKRK